MYMEHTLAIKGFEISRQTADLLEVGEVIRISQCRLILSRA